MTPEEMREARLTLGLKLREMADMLGYTGAHAAQQIHKLEVGSRDISPPVARLVKAYLDGYRPEDWPAS